MSRILYVTTMNKALYDKYGKSLIETCLANTDSDMLIVYEDSIGLVDSDRVIYHNVYDDGVLDVWLAENDDIIPVEYGGSNTDIQFEIATLGQYNYRASKWFRKVLALRAALKHYNDYDAVVLIDVDSFFKKRLNESYVLDCFGDHDVIYHLGEWRKSQPDWSGAGVESSLVGFRGRDGVSLITLFVNEFLSGDFRRHSRWDDGFVLRKVIEANPSLNTCDVVANKPPYHVNPSHVVPIGPLGDYIEHMKGKTQSMVQSGAT